MKKFVTIIILCLGLFAMVGCKKEEKVGLERIKDNGKLVVGFTEFPPFGYMEDGKYLGFDLELAKMVADELGVKLEAKYVDWDALALEVKTNVDCIWNAMTITEERKKNMSFTKPYWKTNLKAVVEKESTLTKVDDLKGKKVAVEKGGTADINLSGNKDYTVVKFKKVSEALLAVSSGQADVLVADETYCNTVLAKGTEKYKVLPGTIGDIELYGIGFRLNEVDLKDEVDKIIDKLEQEGKIKPLLAKYFGETNGFYR